MALAEAESTLVVPDLEAMLARKLEFTAPATPSLVA